MANTLYPKGAGHMLAGDVDYDADAIQLLFYSGAYNAAHEFHADLTGASIIATSGTLAGRSTALGVFDANDIIVTSVTGSAFAHVILMKWTGSSATSLLLAHYDVATFTPTGGDVTVLFHASGLFSIA